MDTLCAAVAAFERVQIAFAPPLVLSSPTYVWGRAQAAFLANLGRVTTEGGVGKGDRTSVSVRPSPHASHSTTHYPIPPAYHVMHVITQVWLSIDSQR